MMEWRKTVRGRFAATLAGLGCLSLAAPAPAAPAESFSPGPVVGARIPEFTAADQYGKVRSFEDLKGPEGLLLLFFRTADW